MELREAVRRRRMVRDYDPTRQVPAEAVEEILTAALRAPSAGHTQGVSFLVLPEPVEIEAFWAATAQAREPDRWLLGMTKAPLLILIWTSEAAYLDRYAAPDKGWDDRSPARWSAPYWYVDAGMASLAALLTAVDHELGACFFGIPPEHQGDVREAFGVPEDQLSVGAISVGYPAAGTRRSPPRAPRRDREERVHVGRWADSGLSGQ